MSKKYIKWDLEKIQNWLDIEHPDSKILNTEYMSNIKLSWQCDQGHTWLARWHGIHDSYSWCPHCSGNSQLTIEEINNILNVLHPGSKCLAVEYINNSTKMPFQCSKGHIWSATSDGIVGKRHRWCPHCAGLAKLNINMMYSFAATKINKAGNRAARCNSTEYINSRSDLNWTCQECFKDFDMHWGDVNQNHWCPHCANNIKLTLKKINTVLSVIHPGGKCLATEYINNKTIMLFQCDANREHIWSSHWNNIIACGNWCPECLHKHQTQCKKILETLLGHIDKLTGNYIDNMGKKRKIYFDGYNEKHRVAFEYNGEQHYKFHYFHQGDIQKFERQKQRDIEAQKYCLENHITLLIIPYTADNNLEQYITTIIKQQKEIILW